MALRRILCGIMLAGSAMALAAVEFRLNGNLVASIEAAELFARSGPLGLAGDRVERGLSLEEFYPLLSEAWELSIDSAGASRSLESPDLAERLPRAYVLLGERGSLDLSLDGQRYTGLRSLNLRGEILAEDGLEVWLSWEGVPELKAEIARFAKEKGKSIKTVEVPNTETKLLAMARAGGRLPDLVMIQSDYVPALSQAKVLQSLDYLDASELQAKGLAAFRSQGRLWAQPLYYDAQLVFYNTKLVRKAPSSDWSLADLEAAARPLKGRIKAPLAWNAYSAYWLLPFMAGYGKSSLLEADGSLRVDDAASAQALKTLLRLKQEGLLEPAEREAMVSWFASGQAAFILSGSYSIPEFSRLGLPFGVAPYPRSSSGGAPIAPLLDFKGFAMSRRTTSPVLARRLLGHLTAQSFQGRFTAALGKLPANEAAQKASKSENPYYEALAASAAIGIVVPPAEAYGIYKNTMWKLLRLLFSGQMGVEECLSTAQRLMDENFGPRS